MNEPTLYGRIPRPLPGALASLHGIGVADLFDEMDAADRDRRLMQGLRTLGAAGGFAGPAITVEVPAGDNLMVHAALAVVAPGDVLVISNGGVAQGALWGENVTIQAQALGAAAAVLDGPVRDTAALRTHRLPVHATIVSVAKATKERIGRINMPIVCAGVSVRPGDIVIGDEDGVIVVAPDAIAALAVAARRRMARADALRAGIAAGRPMYEQLGIAKQLAALGAGFVDAQWTATPPPAADVAGAPGTHPRKTP